MNSLTIDSQPTAQLRATRSHEKAKPDGGDKDLIRVINRILGQRSLGIVPWKEVETTRPNVLDDVQDSLPF